MFCFMENSSDLHHDDSPNPSIERLNTFVTSVKYILASLLYEQPRTILQIVAKSTNIMAG